MLLVVKNLPAKTGNAGLIPGSGRSPGVENGNPLQYSCLENSMDRGAWRARVHGISQARMPEWVAISSPRGSSLNIVSYNFYRSVPFSIQIYCHNIVCSIF